VLFVSHDMTAISRLATRSLVLQDGAVVFCGPTQDAIGFYTTRRQTQAEELSARQDRTGDGVVRLESIRFYDSQGHEVEHVGSGDALTIVVKYRSRVQRLRYEDLALDMRFTDVLGHPVTMFSTRFSSSARGELDHEGALVCHVPRLTLAEETYGVDLWLAYRAGLADRVIGAAELRVVTANFYGTGQEPVKRKHGAALIDHQWTARAECAEQDAPALVEQVS
ncbi:MAG: Wzt carbohydrate-binding domain-containing protein, partial [Pyrinomonadaceae bacterium]